MSSATVSNLSPRQKECLRHVASLKSSKQIAQELKIAPSTVDGYIAEAVSILGVANRKQAALMLIEFETTTPPDVFGGQSSRVEPSGQGAPFPPQQPGGEGGHVHDGRQPTYRVDRPAFLRLFRAKGGGNDLSIGQRLIYIAGAAMFVMVITILAVTLSDSLTRLGRPGG